MEATISTRRPRGSSETTSPALRDAAFDFADQAAEGGGFVGFVEIDRLAEEVAELIDGKAAGDEPDAAGLALRLFDWRVGLVLVADVADDLLQQIFDGDQAGDAAVFIDHDAHVLLFALHLAQQLVAALGFRNEGGGALDGWRRCGCGPPRR